MYSNNRIPAALKRIKIDGSNIPHFECDRGLIHVSAETEVDVADYYGEYRGGYPWVNPKLEKFAEKHDCHWEWDNPGSIVLIEE